MDFTTTDEHRALRAAVADIAGRFGNDYYTRKAEAREFTGELWATMGKHGYVGINIPEEFGGGGAGLVELAIVCEETAAAGCPLLLLLVSSAISGEVIVTYGTSDQKRRWLPRLAAGSGKIVFAVTEPDAGSNTHRLSTVATRDGDGRPARAENLHLRLRRSRRRPRRCPHRHRRRHRRRHAVAVRRRHRRPRPDRPADSGLGRVAGAAVHAHLR